jgi:hypothetical protein
VDNNLEIKILAEAIDWFEEDETRYNPNLYLGKGDLEDLAQAVPGRDVVAACAIGGIEQALWQVSGRKIDATPERGGGQGERQFAYGGTHECAIGAPAGDEKLFAYWSVMQKLNLETQRRALRGDYDEYFDEDYGDEDYDAHKAAVEYMVSIEAVTEQGDTEESRDNMLSVMRFVLEGMREKVTV